MNNPAYSQHRDHRGSLTGRSKPPSVTFTDFSNVKGSQMYAEPFSQSPRRSRSAKKEDKLKRQAQRKRLCKIVAVVGGVVIILGIVAAVVVALLTKDTGSDDVILGGDIRVTSWTYTSDLKDPTSNNYTYYADIFNKTVKNALLNMNIYKTCSIRSFSSGSVIVSYTVSLLPDGDLNEKQTKMKAANALTKYWKTADEFTVDIFTIKFNDFSGCEVNACDERSECRVDQPGSVKCVCERGYSGPSCQDYDPCVTFNCIHGTCHVVEDDVMCICEDGYRGDDCNELSICYEVSCQNGGVCMETDGKCRCPDTHIGASCEHVDPCLSSPCLNDGQCLSVPDDGSYLCLCTPGNVGVNCMGCREDEWTCLSPPSCISPLAACHDVDAQCQEYEEDPLPCVCVTELPCGGGQCRPITSWCDGTMDCPDGSDEEKCGSQQVCDIGQIACGDNSTCINDGYWCDGELDCADWTDEMQCVCDSPDQEVCVDTGVCIYSDTVCDGQNNCGDWSDELDCECAADTFQCLDEFCIPNHYYCDGEIDCPDGSDEYQDCHLDCIEDRISCADPPMCMDPYPKSVCESCRLLSPGVSITCDCDPEFYVFACQDTGLCRYIEDWCNGSPDCKDGSDEPNGCTVSCPSGFYYCDGSCEPYEDHCLN